MQTEAEKIYLKIARALEDDIISGLIKEDEIVPSTNQFAEFYKINPGTAAKGVGLLLAEGMLYKKRGVGLFVAEGAREKLRGKRRENFRERYILPLLSESRKINLSKTDLIAMITKE